MSIYISIYLFVTDGYEKLFWSIYLHTYITIYLISIYLIFNYQSIYQYIYICLSVYISLYPSICLSIHNVCYRWVWQIRVMNHEKSKDNHYCSVRRMEIFVQSWLKKCISIDVQSRQLPGSGGDLFRVLANCFLFFYYSNLAV